VPLAANPVIVLVNVLPAMAPGLSVQFPAGNPLKTALPVTTAHVGWVMAPTIGAFVALLLLLLAEQFLFRCILL